MAKLLMLSGLPASGKSTRAEAIVRQGGWVRLNRDLLRTMLHFDKFTPKNEGVTVDSEKCLAILLLKSNVNVVIDDTNLNKYNKDMWKQVAALGGATFEHEHIDTDWEECVKRDIMRHKTVGKEVIVNMALQHGVYKKDDEKGFILCDLDGTLCDITHRLSHVKVPEGEKKDWKKFFSGIPHDTPRYEVIKMLHQFQDEGHTVIFISARPDTYRAETMLWLYEHYKMPFFTLIMRAAHDKRPDTQVKKEMYEKYFKDKYHVHAVIDDRPSVIRMWREQGLHVIDVGHGIEF